MATEVTTPLSETVASYLGRPYARLVVPEADGTFRGEVLEFPGCLATGDTPTETLAALEEAAMDWLEAALERSQNIPDPIENTEFSGRFVLRLPKSLHKKAAILAERDGVSLNQFIVMGLAEHVGERARPQNQVTQYAAISNVNAGIFIAQGSIQNVISPGHHGTIQYTSAAKGITTLTNLSALDSPLRQVG